MSRIYDCFTFFKELDILEIRLIELSDLVDYFVLVESTRTFTGNPKPLFYAEHRSRFAPFAEKIVHVVVDDMPTGTGVDAWVREVHQRNAIIRGLGRSEPLDYVIVSDVDEIPKATAVEHALTGKKERRVCFFYCDHYRYRLNLRATRRDDHLGPVMVMRKQFRRANDLRAFWPRSGASRLPAPLVRMWDVTRVRRKLGFWGIPQILPSAAWHFSYVGDSEFILDKLRAYSHQEYNIPEITAQLTEQDLADAIRQDRFLHQTECGFRVESLNDEYPKALRRHPERYRNLLLSDA
jgi:beta-1,4-mannosyl-glycoprotein beta-1,4-N-acetylglucosaminyltransferase